MNLAIDIGNTFIKAGLFRENELVQFFPHSNLSELQTLNNKYQFRYVIISSVRKEIGEIKSIFSNAEKLLIMGTELSIPIKNLYKTPHTLGMDRISGAVASTELFHNQHRLVIDAGTCITYDFTDINNQYLGGGISPGVEMRLKALNTFTDKLPLIQKRSDFHLIGQNTEESILSGVLNGVIAELEGIIQTYSNDYEGLKVILCGGDAGFFESKIKQPIFVVPDLILRGLNSILLHNVS